MFSPERCHLSKFSGLDWAVFKNLRTSTKLFLLCGMFVGAIVLATYSLIEEKQIAIGFVRKELVGAQYLEALRGVYAVILAEDADASTAQSGSVDAALDALAKAEAETGGSLHTAQLAETLATAVRDLVAAGPGGDKRTLTVEALTRARDLAARIGDEFEPHSRPGSRQLLCPEHRREESACPTFANGGVAVTPDRCAIGR